MSAAGEMISYRICNLFISPEQQTSERNPPTIKINRLIILFKGPVQLNYNYTCCFLHPLLARIYFISKVFRNLRGSLDPLVFSSPLLDL